MTRFEIHDDDIRYNIALVRQAAGVPVWGVVKYNGYGMGLVHMAGLLREGGITRFAVCDAAEAHMLRTAGFETEDILLLSPQSAEAEIVSALHDGAIFSVGSVAYADRLVGLSYREGCSLRSHITVDTGMGRFGFLPSDRRTIRSLYFRQGIRIEGIYSHFSSAWNDRRKTMAQYAVFTDLLRQLREDGIDCGMAHIANSPALFRFDGLTLDAVRIGSALVGRVGGTNPSETGLHRAGTLATTVCDVRELPKGSRVSYGGEWKLRKDAKIAVLSAGSQCGIPEISIRSRILKHFPKATINGASAELIATHSFSHAFADVTGLNVKPGDLAYIDVNPLHVDSSVERCYL